MKLKKFLLVTVSVAIVTITASIGINAGGRHNPTPKPIISTQSGKVLNIQNYVYPRLPNYSSLTLKIYKATKYHGKIKIKTSTKRYMVKKILLKGIKKNNTVKLTLKNGSVIKVQKIRPLVFR